MFTILSIVLYISILTNNNMSNDAAVYFLAFGWILFIFAGLLLDGIAVLAIISLILFIVIGIILLAKRKNNKNGPQQIERNKSAVTEKKTQIKG